MERLEYPAVKIVDEQEGPGIRHTRVLSQFHALYVGMISLHCAGQGNPHSSTEQKTFSEKYNIPVITNNWIIQGSLKMAFVWDTVTFINLVLCVIIVVMGIMVYLKRETFGALLIGIAFGLFAISHLYALLGLGTSWELALISARTSGYILVIAALYLFLTSGFLKDAE